MRNKKDLFLAGLLFVGVLCIQNLKLGKLLHTFPDEGVYLFASKLILDGLVPYHDFFLAHPPFGILVSSLLLAVSHFNMNLYHLLYTMVVFSTIFPLYFTVLSLTRSRLAAITSVCLFSFFPELTQWDARQLSLRQLSLPFWATALYFLTHYKHPKLTGILLAFFSMCVVTNAFLAGITVVLYIGLQLLSHPFETIIRSRNNWTIALFFSIPTFLYYTVLLLDPAARSNIFEFQLTRPYLSLDYRIDWVKGLVRSNWMIFAAGMLGGLLWKGKGKYIGYISWIGIPVVMSVGNYFYPHYLTIFAVPLAIAAFGYFSWMHRLPANAVTLGILTVTLTIFAPRVIHAVAQSETPEFFETVEHLKRGPRPLFTIQPSFTMYAGQEVPYFYHMVDMRSLSSLGTNLSDAEYEELLAKSNTVLVDSFLREKLPERGWQILQEEFTVTFSSGGNDVYIRLVHPRRDQ